MKIARVLMIGLVATGLASADETGAKTRFAAPKRVRSGEAFLGEGRLYPSPVLHDADGDGLRDIVVGDLFGAVSFAPRVAGKQVAVPEGRHRPGGVPFEGLPHRPHRPHEQELTPLEGGKGEATVVEDHVGKGNLLLGHGQLGVTGSGAACAIFRAMCSSRRTSLGVRSARRKRASHSRK